MMKKKFRKCKSGFVLLFGILFSVSLSAQTSHNQLTVFFESRSYELPEEAVKLIDDKLASLSDDSIIQVTVRTYPENSEDSTFSVKLSKKRAEVVKLFLFGRGVDQHIISMLYFGDIIPPGTIKSEEDKIKSKRADIFFVSQRKGLEVTTSKSDSITNIQISSTKSDTTTILPLDTQITLAKTESFPVKFKTHKSLRFLSATISYTFPAKVEKFEQKVTSKKNQLEINLPCFDGDKFLSAIAINKNGDTLTINNLPLNSLSKKVLFSKCPKIDHEIETKFLGIFPVHKRNIYRKYMVKPDQFFPKN